MSLRLALVGLGKIARDQHLAAIAGEPGVELAAIVSRNATLPGVPNFKTLSKLFAAGLEIDAVSLCAPPAPRRAQAAEALANGKHVMLEKPPGATVAELAPLRQVAAERGLTLYASWHSRSAAAVERAREALAGRRLRRVDIAWKEDIRHWHPGQDWILEPGGLGVFDPAINALSILTRILPQPPFVRSATLDFPENRQAPLAATLELADPTGLEIHVSLSSLQTGPQTWDIRVATDEGEVLLSQGGRVLQVEGRAPFEGHDREYAALYRHFVTLAATGESDVDLLPLQIVADSFMVARRRTIAPFDF